MIKKLICVLALLCALPLAAQQPVNVAQVGGKNLSLYSTFFSATVATGTATSSAVRIPGSSTYGSLAITGSSIAGSPSGCSIALKSQQNTGTTAGSAFATQAFTPGNSYQTFLISPSSTTNATGDTIIATYACSSTYPSAGTITVTFTPIEAVAEVIPPATLPLPTGAATSANQTNGTHKTQVVDGSGNVQPSGDTVARSVNVAVNDGTNVIGTAAHPVKVDPTGTTTQPVSLASSPLPTGASTLAEQQTQTTSLQLIDDALNAANTAFSKAVAFAGQMDDTSTTQATENNVAPVRVSADRALHVQLRSGAAEVGTSGAPLRTDPTGTTTQPVSGTVTANLGTNSGNGSTGSAVPSTAHYNANNVGGNLVGQIGCDSSIVYDASTSGSTQLVALTSSQQIRICGFTVFSGGTVNVKLIDGTGTACATSPSNLTPAWQFTAQTGIADGSPIFRGLTTRASNALCINTSGAIAVQAIVYYTKF